jgi:hypothetical protein
LPKFMIHGKYSIIFGDITLNFVKFPSILWVISFSSQRFSQSSIRVQQIFLLPHMLVSAIVG